eukprot:11411563-Alexandrium_andersonii.AAC.1
MGRSTAHSGQTYRGGSACASTSMLAEAVQLWFSRCACRANVADSPPGRGRTPFHTDSLGPLPSYPKRTPD